MQKLGLLFVLAILAGCASDGGSDGGDESSSTSSTAATGNELPKAFSMDWDESTAVTDVLGRTVLIGEFEVPGEAQFVNVTISKVSLNVALFAPNGVLVGPAGTNGDGDAFSNAQYGNVNSEGVVELFGTAELRTSDGTWSVYLTSTEFLPDTMSGVIDVEIS